VKYAIIKQRFGYIVI